MCGLQCSAHIIIMRKYNKVNCEADCLVALIRSGAHYFGRVSDDWVIQWEVKFVSG